MSKFYGMVRGNRGAATRGGSANSGFKATAQSFDGSVITCLDYDSNKQLKVRLETSDYSSTYGDVVFSGTFEEFKEAMKLLKDIKDKKVSVVRHREKSNKQLQLERAFGEIK